MVLMLKLFGHSVEFFRLLSSW